MLAAEYRRAPTPRDLATLQAAARSRDAQTARAAVRALGRLERPSLIPDITLGLSHGFPENRAEAANALAQAAQGFRNQKTPGGLITPASALATLAGTLAVEDEASVRAALCEAIGRLPYRSADDVEAAEGALLDAAARNWAIADRLGVAKGFEALTRLQRTVRAPGADAIAVLKRLAQPAPVATNGASDTGRARLDTDPIRDVRVRRLALEALISAGAVDEGMVERGLADVDPQVRRLAVRAAVISGLASGAIITALADAAPMVRIEALRGLRSGSYESVCAAALDALDDPETQVALVAIDQLAACGEWADAEEALTAAVNDFPRAGSARGWHRAAHAIVALAAAAPARAAGALGRFTGSSIWQLRMYAARAAATLGDMPALEALARDADDNVVEAAIDALASLSGHRADPLFAAALGRPGYQVVRAAALALHGSPAAEAAPALSAALARLVDEGHANSADARAALRGALDSLGVQVPPGKPARSSETTPAWLDRDDLSRLAAARARITIAAVGRFDLALVPTESPATVLRFVDLAESGYYNGLTFHRVVPNMVVQGGSPAASEYVGDADHMRDEVGLWPHVRGAVGISTRGRDTGDAQIFINLVDNPRFDHEYTVFAQVLSGIEVIDRILEGDTIERVEIIP